MESPKSPAKDYYAVLGVPADASEGEIKKAYRALAQRYHPDRMHAQGDETTTGSAGQMVEINEAFAVLSDRKRRAAHDQEREAAKKPSPAAPAAAADWEIPLHTTTVVHQVTHSAALKQTVAQDYLQKLKTMIGQEGASIHLREEEEKSWLWSLRGKTFGGSYWIGLRVCASLNPNLARGLAEELQKIISKHRSGWKSNFFLFILAFQSLSEGETILKIFRTFCNREENSSRRNLVNIVVLDLNLRRSIHCGKRTREESLDRILRALGIT